MATTIPAKVTKVAKPVEETLASVTGYYDAFKVEFNWGDAPQSLASIVDFIEALKAAGFKGTTFEKKTEQNADVVGKTGVIDKTEKTTTKNGKDAFIAHIKIDDNPEAEPVAIMFFQAGAARKGDRVMITKNESGFKSFYLIDENGEKVPF